MTDITFKSYGICVDSYPKETYGEIDDYALAEQEKLRALHKQTDGDACVQRLHSSSIVASMNTVQLLQPSWT